MKHVGHGQGTWDGALIAAACRRAKLEQGLPADDVPDESECRTTCTNLAYTDRDIQQMANEVAELEHTAADPLAPRPLRDRAAARATRYQAIIERHQASRPSAGDDRESEIR